MHQCPCSDFRLTTQPSEVVASQGVAGQQGENGLVKLTKTSSTPEGCISQDKFFSCHSFVRLSFPCGLLTGRECKDPWVWAFRYRFIYVSMNGSLSLTEASALIIQTKSGIDHERMRTRLNCRCNLVYSLVREAR